MIVTIPSKYLRLRQTENFWTYPNIRVCCETVKERTINNLYHEATAECASLKNKVTCLLTSLATWLRLVFPYKEHTLLIVSYFSSLKAIQPRNRSILKSTVGHNHVLVSWRSSLVQLAVINLTPFQRHSSARGGQFYTSLSYLLWFGITDFLL